MFWRRMSIARRLWLGFGLVIVLLAVVAGTSLVQLSGFAFPIRNMPLVFRWLAELFPATHYIRVTRAIYVRGEGPLSLLPELAFLLLFGAALIALALRTIGTRS